MKTEIIRGAAFLAATLALLCMGHSAGVDSQDLQKELSHRRNAVIESMAHRGMLVLFSGPAKSYSGDVEYEYRQENNFHYLTGLRQADCTLVLMPQNEKYREILFVPEKDPLQELWTGKMLSRKEARDLSGIETVWAASRFDAFLNRVLYGRPYGAGRYSDSPEYRGFFADLARGEAEVFLLLEPKPGLKGRLEQNHLFAERLRERFSGITIRDMAPKLHRLRMNKSDFELSQLRRAIDITVEAHQEVLKKLRPEDWEYQIEALVEYIFKRSGAFQWAFPSIVASGPNATILHYQESLRQGQGGELLLLDIGAEYNFYAADLTRTVPISGRFSRQQAEIYELVLEAQKAAMAAVRPGSSLPQIHDVAVEVIRAGLLRLGLIADKSSRQYRVFFPHGVGHWLGMDVHDVGPYEQKFEPGMVLTVEPGIYVRQDAPERLAELGAEPEAIESIRKQLDQYLHIGVRIEDDVVVTQDGYELLSASAPREIRDIEAMMRERR